MDCWCYFSNRPLQFLQFCGSLKRFQILGLHLSKLWNIISASKWFWQIEIQYIETLKKWCEIKITYYCQNDFKTKITFPQTNRCTRLCACVTARLYVCVRACACMHFYIDCLRACSRVCVCVWVRKRENYMIYCMRRDGTWCHRSTRPVRWVPVVDQTPSRTGMWAWTSYPDRTHEIHVLP